MTTDIQTCPLCKASHTTPFAQFRERDYRHCPQCDLVFIPGDQHLSADDECARYRRHQNRPDDAGYRAFLNRLASQLVPHLTPGARGLDYGSGPGPVLSVMLEERGFDMSIYDPFFAPDPASLQTTYDFIACTETVEHFARPAAEFSRFDGLLRPGGRLGIMTQTRNPETDFHDWWYIRDETHVAFYSRTTLRWIGRRWSWQTQFPAPTITIYEKITSNCHFDSTTLKTSIVIPSEVEESRAFRENTDPSLRLRSGQASSG